MVANNPPHGVDPGCSGSKA